MEKKRAGEGCSSKAAPALIAVHPKGFSIAIAVGPELLVFNLLGGSPLPLTHDGIPAGQPFHTDTIRVIRFGARGRFFASGGDDNTLKIWIPESWTCIASITGKKKITALAIRETINEGNHVCYADESCFVWVVDLDLLNQPVKLLNHHGTIVNLLLFSPDDRLIVSCDMDMKIRMTKFPDKPLEGAKEIRGFCIGHEGWITGVVFPDVPEGTPGLIVSGSSDCTVMLWDLSTGNHIYTSEVGAKLESLHRLFPEAGHLHCSKAEPHGHAVTELCATRSLYIAASVQSLRGIVLLTCNVSEQTLYIAKVVCIGGEVFIPTCLASCSHARDMWLITGNYPSLARVAVISGIGVEVEPVVLADDKMPVVTILQKYLQGIADHAVSAAAEAVKTDDNEESRKKQRTD